MIGDGQGVTPANPKRYDFANSLLGHVSRPRLEGIGGNYGPRMEGLEYDAGSLVDEQRFRLMDPDRSAPPPKAYGHYKEALIDRATANNIDPTFYADIAYAGAKEHRNIKPLIVQSTRCSSAPTVSPVPRELKSCGVSSAATCQCTEFPAAS